VPDLGQVPQLDSGVVAAGLEPVVAFLQRDRVQSEQQSLLPGQAGGQPPGAVPAGRPVITGGGEGEPRQGAGAGSAGRIMAGRGVVAGFRSCAAVADGVAVLVGDGQAPSGLQVSSGGAGQVAGQGRVDGA
jgi:hypothetical protein